MSVNGAERRRLPRIARQLRAWAGVGVENKSMQTVDVGVGGACLEGEDVSALKAGDTLRLALCLEESSAPVEVDAEVRWARSGRVGVRWRGRLPAALAASLAVWLSGATAHGAEDAVPEFDPNATVELDMNAGGMRPDEYQVLAAFQEQYDELDACVEAAKQRKRARKQLPGDVEMHVLLNPKGKRPLGINATMPKPIVKERGLRECLRAAVAKAPYPSYDGPPVVVALNFELDPGDTYVEED